MQDERGRRQLLPLAGVVKGARFSEDLVYRYSLTRSWNVSGRHIAWLMLNPSTADASIDDPTIRRCVDFSKVWGFGSLEVVNIFALRSTDPALLSVHPEPVGPENDAAIVAAVARASMTVAAWGKGETLVRRARAAAVAQMVTGLHCLGVNKDGQPKHPLYVRGRTVATPWEMPRPGAAR